jgi:hypothetical protein
MLPGLTKAKPDRLSTSQLVFCQQTRFSRSCVSSRDGTAFHLPDFRLMPFISAFLRAFVRSSTGFQILRATQSLTVSPADCRVDLRLLRNTPGILRLPFVFEVRSCMRFAPPARLALRRSVICTDDAVSLAFRIRRLSTVKRTRQHPREENL